MKRNTMWGVVLASAVLMLAATPARAHHSMVAEFSVEKPITLRGTVSKVEWLNPHGFIHVDVKGADGSVETWRVETGSPLRMKNRGLKPSDFRIGIDVIVGGYAARGGARTVAGMIVTFPARETAAVDQDSSFSLGR